ncbi:phenylalanyl-tRNA synthetase, beta subunit [Candidatus Tremblaya phenacola PAVE]|nr:phenylalanyl-tRNA synthetase, beta subunit [Candidatus Tremblaya phenacola PAVE]
MKLTHSNLRSLIHANCPPTLLIGVLTTQSAECAHARTFLPFRSDGAATLLFDWCLDYKSSNSRTDCQSTWGAALEASGLLRTKTKVSCKLLILKKVPPQNSKGSSQCWNFIQISHQESGPRSSGIGGGRLLTTKGVLAIRSEGPQHNLLLVRRDLRAVRGGPSFTANNNEEAVSNQVGILEKLVRVRPPDCLPNSLGHLRKIQEITSQPNGLNEIRALEKVRGLLVGRGYSELLGSHFITAVPQPPKQFGIISINNPMSKTGGALRSSILEGWFNTIQLNPSSLPLNTQLFEIGSSYQRQQYQVCSDTRLLIKHTLAAIRWGNIPTLLSSNNLGLVETISLKHDFESLLELCGVAFQTKTTDHPLFNPKAAEGIVVRGKLIGNVGQLHQMPALMRGGRPLILSAFEIEIGAVLMERFRPNQIGRGSCCFVTKDISFVLDPNIRSQILTDLVFSTARKEAAFWIESASIFDTFKRGPSFVLGLRLSFVRNTRSYDALKMVLSIINHSIRTDKILVGPLPKPKK